MQVTKIIVGVVLVVAAVGCAKKNPWAGRQRHEAPRGKGDVGIVLEKASPTEVEDILNDFPQAQVRILNKEHGLYEIFGVSQEDVQSRTQGQVSRNLFFHLIKPQPAGLLSVPAPEGLEVDGLEPCRGNLPSPQAIMTVTQPTTNLNGATIQVGDSIKFNSLASQPHPSAPLPLKSALVILPPSSSATEPQVLQKSEGEFKPDAMGIYQIVIVVQDSQGACAMDGVQFLVTSNPVYNGPRARELTFDLQQMKHLAQVNAEKSWKTSQGSGITIAVLDSGVNYNHPSLAPNMDVSTTEIAGNDLDDDHNGLVDDVIGYDFVNDDAFPFDDDGHGSHVSGLAAGKQFGLAKQAKILALKALNGLGGDPATIAAAMLYAVDSGARIINMSLGAPALLPHPAIVHAAAYAESKGVLVVTASGNGDPQTGMGFSIDEIPFFPAALPNDNIVSVAAFDATSVLSIYSNFGAKSVDVAAPGGLIPEDPVFSATMDNPRHNLFEGLNGTSMATPVVSGIAAQVLSVKPSLTAAEVKDILMRAGQVKPELAAAVGSSRHIDASAALDLVAESHVLF